MKNKKWTEVEIDLLKKIYPSEDYSYDEMLSYFPNRTIDSIRWKVKKIKLKSNRKNSKQANLKNSKTKQIYKINEKYFDEIDHADKAYWLGFILADGNISKKKNRLQIGLHPRDKDHLIKFKKCIGSNHRLFDEYKKTNNGTINSICCIYIKNLYLYNRIKKIGIEPCKTTHEKPLDCISEKFERDFWRGVVDGDGTVKTFLIKKRGKLINRFDLQLYGSKEICEGFKKFCLKHIDSKSSVHKKEKNLHRYSLTCNYAKKIAEVLYDGSNIYLDRKYNEYLKIR